MTCKKLHLEVGDKLFVFDKNIYLLDQRLLLLKNYFKQIETITEVSRGVTARGIKSYRCRDYWLTEEQAIPLENLALGLILYG